MVEKNPYLSVVIPVYQGENLIDELVIRLVAYLSLLTDRFEIILIDDGSQDRSWIKIEEKCEIESRIKGIQLSRNFGQHSAIMAGIRAALGEWMVIMDCDLQDRPQEIISIYRKALEGYDVVLGRRIKRFDSRRKRIFSRLFYFILSMVSGIKHDSAIANFGIYHRKVIEAVLQMQRNASYFPAMVEWVGFKKTSIPVRNDARFSGQSSYSFRRALALASDAILFYGARLLQLLAGVGMIIFFTALIFAFALVYWNLKIPFSTLGYGSFIVSFSLLSGLVLFGLSILGLYLGKIFEGRPMYLISKKKNE